MQGFHIIFLGKEIFAEVAILYLAIWAKRFVEV